MHLFGLGDAARDPLYGSPRIRHEAASYLQELPLPAQVGINLGVVVVWGHGLITIIIRGKLFVRTEAIVAQLVFSF